jgi:6,7-dimethyl-8-ribityllumazine synthase
MTEHDRPGTFNPFEDTGDWPFRDAAAPAPPREPVEEERPPAGPSLFDREAREQQLEKEPEKEFVPVIPPPEAEAETEPEAEAEPEVELGPEAEAEPEPEAEAGPEPVPEPEVQAEAAVVEIEEDLPAPEAFPEEEPEPHEPFAEPDVAGTAPDQHAPGELLIPQGPEVLEGTPNGFRRTVAVVVARFNADVTNRLLESAVDALVDAHVNREAITVVPVPGAFELPLAAMALAKTRRFSCIVALGCVIRGETPHFDFVAGEAASGLQLAAIETGVPVSFGLLTVENQAQAEARIGKGAEAARAALEMAELFTQVRTRASRPG